MSDLKRSASAILFISFVFCLSASAQENEPAARSIVSLDFKTQRKPKEVSAVIKPSVKPNVARRQKAVAVVSDPRRKYSFTKRIAAKKTAVKATGKSSVNSPAAAKAKFEELGVTFWRLRPTTDDDEGAPLFPVRIGERTEDWAAERVSSETVFRPGDRVRFTVESSRTGYIYIANREFYADGLTGAANIIFPTLRTRGGNNRVNAGSLIEIPSASDSVPYFTIKPRRADYAGEELIVLILPNELPNYEKTLRAQPVTTESLAKWFNDWETFVDIYNAEDGIGTAYTEVEARAANTASRSLTQEEPLPQTVFRVSLKADAPLFVAFRMNASQ